MARVQDWLLNSMAKDTNLIDDSPQFRALEQARQKGNLTRAANTAMREVDKRIQQTEMDTLRTNMETQAKAAPFPVPLSGPDNPMFAPESAPLVPGADEFSSNPITAEDEANRLSKFDTEEDANIASPEVIQSVQNIAAITGLPIEKVALMTLLGKDIARTQIDQPVAPPTIPPDTSNMPVPLGGPSALNTPPPVV